MDDLELTPAGRRNRAAVNAAISATMSKQEGQISRSQLLAAGVTSRGIATRLAAGSLIQRTEPAPSSRRGRATSTKPSSGKQRRPRTPPTAVFSGHAGPLSLEARRWLGLLSAPEPAWLGHTTIFALAGLERPGRHPIHVVHLGGGWNAPRGVVPHRTTSMPPTDTTIYQGRSGTTLNRALLDATGDTGNHRVNDERLDDLLDSAVRLQIYDGADMVRVLNDRPTHHGNARLVEAIGRLDATSGTFRSNFERRTKRLIEGSTRIPDPVVNVLVEGYESDLWFYGTRAIIECDGRDYHRSPAQIAKDEQREAILRARGFKFLRLRWHHIVYEQDATLARIERFVLANLEPPRPGH